ncbi:hypothetical protein GCM10009715_25430 [Paeniglutamicibacter psychrophenolicus]|uniref:Chemotaxis protein histidine kinase CheA n=1 Tax=Paeniglutamicibacter psychrophenolicus TaxID=257454 RepID=A0ABS4WE77_9MICC|nr:hypothetical protein [Paeniglutamicibacter psychrophenolicus]MBP2374496.1 chemotaxis protein histidine kinase CheA [Paeniglutamicibacter psychrophenolicus]
MTLWLALALVGCGGSTNQSDISQSAAAQSSAEALKAEQTRKAAASSYEAAQESALAEEQAAAESSAAAQAEADELAAEASAEAEAEASAKAEAEAAAAAAKKSKLAIRNAEPVSARKLAKLVKNPDNYKGDVIVVYGEITQFDAATGTCSFRANIANSRKYETWDYEYNSLFTAGDGVEDCPALDDFVADDQVKMTATSLGSLSYDTQIGGSTTVPYFQVEKISMLK